ncbi:class I lanthipeptide [Pedobacter gandavensis]|uniref:class I lanthipeptide n=1 Tax=Pedobacter gandavensis TaxID=2679963 RepID=UPI002931066E|nr:class I lanthipeptide [Pedobacter gandavensis]
MKKDLNAQDKLTLFKKKIANLSENEMNNVLGGNQAYGTIGGETKSTVHNFTCTACTHTSNQSDAGKCAEIAN